MMHFPRARLAGRAQRDRHAMPLWVRFLKGLQHPPHHLLLRHRDLPGGRCPGSAGRARRGSGDSHVGVSGTTRCFPASHFIGSRSSSTAICRWIMPNLTCRSRRTRMSSALAPRVRCQGHPRADLAATRPGTSIRQSSPSAPSGRRSQAPQCPPTPQWRPRPATASSHGCCLNRRITRHLDITGSGLPKAASCSAWQA